MLTIYLATATCGLGALLLHQVDRFGAARRALVVACTLVLVAVLETARERKESEEEPWGEAYEAQSQQTVPIFVR